MLPGHGIGLAVGLAVGLAGWLARCRDRCRDTGLIGHTPRKVSFESMGHERNRKYERIPDEERLERSRAYNRWYRKQNRKQHKKHQEPTIG